MSVTVYTSPTTYTSLTSPKNGKKENEMDKNISSEIPCKRISNNMHSVDVNKPFKRIEAKA